MNANSFYSLLQQINKTACLLACFELVIHRQMHNKTFRLCITRGERLVVACYCNFFVSRSADQVTVLSIKFLYYRAQYSEIWNISLVSMKSISQFVDGNLARTSIHLPQSWSHPLRVSMICGPYLYSASLNFTNRPWGKPRLGVVMLWSRVYYTDPLFSR